MAKLSALAGFLLLAGALVAQPIDVNKRVTLTGNVSPRLKAGVDQGPVDPSMVLPYVTLALRPSPKQQAELDQLLAQQRDPSSPNYRRWLTPEQYAERFGVKQTDIDRIVAWLGQQNLTVKSVARGRISIAFSGTASQMGIAFGVEIHHFKLGGELHYANTSNPVIPAEFQGLVTAVRGLHDLRFKPRAKPRVLEDGEHALAPADIAVLYDINPLYNAGINATGQTIAIAGQTDLPLTDIQTYRTTFNLPANVPTTLLVPDTTDPGISQGDLQESELDVELTGAVARNAKLLFVYSENEDDAFQYVIDQNLAPILTTSYGACELQVGTAEGIFEQTLVLQANAQGMTVFGPSGDNAALDCSGDGNAAGTFPDEDSLAVDYPGSMPQMTAVGGLELNEGTGTYWSSTGAALSYVPEMIWNDSAFDDSPSGGGGGASVLFDKPWWQAGAGVPADNVRDVPDVALAASADHDGYVIYTNGTAQVYGGTSASTPEFAAIAALVAQYQVSNGLQTSNALGQINPVLYSLATVPGVFHDITVGTTAVPPCDVQAGCTLPATGYSAGPGYDQASGLGSVDVFNLAKAWHAATLTRIVSSETLSASAVNVAFTDTTVLTAAVTGAGAAPTGTVRFSTGNSLLGSAAVGANGTAVLTINGSLLAPGANTISAQYEGDGTHSGAGAYAIVTVTTADVAVPTIAGISNAASFTQNFAPGGIISIFGTELAPVTASGSAPIPALLSGTEVTIDGLAAPLYYASPGQLNVQVPYGIPAGSEVTVTVYNGDSLPVSAALVISADAPAIFTLTGGAPTPFTTAAQGQEIFLFITGAGAVTPAIPTGAVPAAGTSASDLPAPNGAVTVTVGGVLANVDFVGIPTWSVGVVQINYTVPSTAPLGAQPVVVSVGGVASAAAMLTVTQ